MPVYISLLRGINVGANKCLPMDRLRASLAVLGFAEVRTYIQSGNVVFRAPKTSTAILSPKIEQRLLADFGFPVPVISRTAAEIKAIFEDNPYLKEIGIDQAHLHVTFLAEPPTTGALQKLKKLTALPDRSVCCGREIYFLLPNGVSKSSLSNNPIERSLLRSGTMRNWRTVSAICEMAAGYK
jgi:uncharacterized protein (DUF1697 family)